MMSVELESTQREVFEGSGVTQRELIVAWVSMVAMQMERNR